MSSPILQIDNSWLSSHRSCSRKRHYRYDLGLTKEFTSPALSFGSAIHAGIAEFRRSGNKDAALACAISQFAPIDADEDEWRTPARVIKTLELYFETPQPTVLKAPSGEPIIEFEFAIDLLRATTLDYIVEKNLKLAGYSGMLYVGVVDAVIDWMGSIYIEDHKTCSSQIRSPRGEKPFINTNFWSHFKPHGATPGYIMGAREYLRTPIHGVMIDAIGVNKLHTCFARQTISWTQEELEEWRQDMLSGVNSFLVEKINNYFPKNPESCHLYNTECMFRDMCKTAPAFRENLKSLYKVDFWNPLTARAKEKEKANETVQ